MPTLTAFILQNATAGLLALLGLAIPIAIHLWNRRPGRTVQVGSVRWLATTANQRLRNLRLEQVSLLMLRAAIVALLALAVAGPLWQRFMPVPPVRGLVLLAPDVLRSTTLPAVRPGIDSLRRLGYELRIFAPGFRPVSTQAWLSTDSLSRLAAIPDSAALTDSGTSPVTRSSALPDDYWARARQAADSFPDQPLRIVATTARKFFFGMRPALPARLTWQPVPLPDSIAWLAGATLAGPDTLRLLVGRSQEDATTFQVIKRVRPRTTATLTIAGFPALRYQPAPAGQADTLQPLGASAVPVATSPLRVLLYADAQHTESARYMRAALQAAAIGLAERLEIQPISSDATFNKATPPNWLLWLSEKPVPATWLAQVKLGAQLWQEAAGAGVSVESGLDLAGLAAAPAVAISRLDTSARRATKQTVTVWQDSQGRPVLTRQGNGAGNFYQLRTRLQPRWSGLPDSPALPELLLQVLRPASATPDAYAPQDLRQLDARQLSAAPSLAAENIIPAVASSLATKQVVATTDLRTALVLAALLLFGLERWLAGRRNWFSPTPAS